MLSKISAFLKGIISGKTEVVEQPVVKPAPVQQDPMTGIIVPEPVKVESIPTLTEEVKKAPAKKKPAAMKAPAKKAPAKTAAKTPAPKKKAEAVKVAPIVIKAKVDPASLEGKTKAELLTVAKSKGIKVSPRMGKAALVKRIVGQ
jgi:hypothetical protein